MVKKLVNKAKNGQESHVIKNYYSMSIALLAKATTRCEGEMFYPERVCGAARHGAGGRAVVSRAQITVVMCAWQYFSTGESSARLAITPAGTINVQTPLRSETMSVTNMSPIISGYSPSPLCD